MSCYLEVGEDLLKYITNFESEGLDHIKLKYSTSEILFSTLSGTSNSASSSSSERTKVKIVITPPNPNMQQDLLKFVDTVRESCAFIAVPLSTCLTGIPAGKILRQITKVMADIKLVSPQIINGKFVIASVGPEHIRNTDRKEAPLRKTYECVRVICEKKNKAVVLEVMHKLLRSLVLRLLEKHHPSVQKFFELLKVVAQFRFRTDRSSKLGYQNLTSPVIKVYTADLTRLPVDVLVCGSDPKFSFNGGAASAIAAKAGPEMVAARDQFLASNPDGLLPHAIGIMDGFELPARFVLFTSIPGLKLKGNASLRGPAQTQLTDMFKRVIEECNKRKLLHVGLPLIGAGKLGASLADCAEMLYQALKSYHTSSLNSNENFIRTINIVNVDPNCTASVLTNFTKHSKSLEHLSDCTVWLVREGEGPSPLNPYMGSSQEGELSDATKIKTSPATDEPCTSPALGTGSTGPVAASNILTATACNSLSSSNIKELKPESSTLCSIFDSSSQTKSLKSNKDDSVYEEVGELFIKGLFLSDPKSEEARINADYAIALALDNALNQNPEALAECDSSGYLSSACGPSGRQSNESTGSLSSGASSGICVASQSRRRPPSPPPPSPPSHAPPPMPTRRPVSGEEQRGENAKGSQGVVAGDGARGQSKHGTATAGPPNQSSGQPQNQEQKDADYAMALALSQEW